ncbi:hypothetical protein Pcinc_026668 [Petrolisthes cinctipes]|uniref:Endoplasmic reticulum resident protein 29 n=1 Tax=Petrolisthes cinctipes TaxID=88211 RepID=A0AAE1K9Z2_PETCI|nr:hypothetical protein Pcinc_026668 [Petrolisthes cinctipes]
MAFMVSKVLIVALMAACMVQVSRAINAKGCTPLDSWTFDKVIPRFAAAMVKFDVAYPYGKKHEEYVKLSAAGRGSPELLVAEVGVKDYGDMENVDLAERFGVDKEQFPHVLLFVKGKEQPIIFQGEFKAEELKKFIRKNSVVYIGLEGCLETFDRLVDRFMATKSSPDRRVLLREAEDEWDKLRSPSDHKIAETYVKLMRKVLEKGDDFVKTEKTRVEGLMAGKKITKEKKDEMLGKLNVLKSFIHEEL